MYRHHLHLFQDLQNHIWQELIDFFALKNAVVTQNVKECKVFVDGMNYPRQFIRPGNSISYNPCHMWIENIGGSNGVDVVSMFT